ncbi:MAG: XRE family transcriptional regulator, partial [Bacteroidetes bacterium]|nr:XRE family transcriptional regulator [Bacteroidota bacterium]
MRKLIHIKTNPEVLKWARESLLLNKQKAAKRSKISITRLDQLEKGDCYPSLNELKQLAKAYNRTIAALLLQKPPGEKPLPKDRRTVNSEILGTFHESTIIAVRKARALVESLIELKKNAGLPFVKFQHKATLDDSPSLIANKLRDVWRLDEIKQFDNPNDVLDAYTERIESFGVAVFQLSLTQDNLRGFSLVDEQMPLIAIKRGSEPTTAKIFTLFHELGHILLNEGSICDIAFDQNDQQVEKWCNAFAGEILAPSTKLLQMKVVRQYITSNRKEWGKKDILELVNYFHIGPLAVLRRLKDLELITNKFYTEKHEKWNKPTFGISTNPEGRNIPKEILKERGRLYIGLAFEAFDRNNIDLKD